MCGSCALLAFSFGFYDSIGNTQNKYFNDFADYDVIVDFEPIPLVINHPALEQLDESQKALLLHVDIQWESYTLAIVDNDFDMVNIPTNELKTGVIIPEYFAEQWNVEIGSNININGYNAVISAIIPQHLGLMIYTSHDYINQLTDEIPDVYNTVYGRSRDMAALTAYLQQNNINFSTIDDDKTSFEAIMESMSVLIWFMIACSVVLGITVLYSVGLINLSAREYEYMFMGVMGYPHKGIMTAHMKETVLQLVLAIPFGFLFGNLLLEIIKGEFSGSNFVISAAIYPHSYLISAAAVIGITALMALVTSRHINRLDIVEGLKAQDD
jgi:putative ABC transport system permease protein